MVKLSDRIIGRLGRAVAAVALLAIANLSVGQSSGFNFTIAYAHALVKQDKITAAPSSTFGLAYQQDLDRRFGAAFDFFYGNDEYGIKAYEGIYSAKFFTSDNDATAFYLGTFLGVQYLKASIQEGISNPSGGTTYRTLESSKVQLPIGLRMGVRGGLDGYFAELFAQVGYAIGNGKLYTTNGETVASSPLYFGVGFSFLGFGWDHKDR